MAYDSGGEKYGVKHGKSKKYHSSEKYGETRTGYEQKDSGYEIAEEEAHAHIREERVHELPRAHEERAVSSRLTQRPEESKIKPLRLVSSEVVGGIFDRVEFLKKRIEEIKSNIETRHAIHKSILSEIEKDVDDRTQFLNAISDSGERRNLKYDISILRKERRNESVQYWRDLVELNTELRALQEEYEVEMKIAAIFGKLKKEVVGDKNDRN